MIENILTIAGVIAIASGMVWMMWEYKHASDMED